MYTFIVIKWNITLDMSRKKVNELTKFPVKDPIKFIRKIMKLNKRYF